MDNMIKLPKGVIVHVGQKKWRGEIPAAVCPVRFLPKEKPARKTAGSGEAEK